MTLHGERAPKRASAFRVVNLPGARDVWRSARPTLLLSIAGACTTAPGPAGDAGEASGHPGADAAIFAPDGGSRPSFDGGARDGGARDAGSRDAATALDAEIVRADAALPGPDGGRDGGEPEATHDAAVDAGLPAAFRAHWTTGDLHVHTIQSNDAQTPLARVLEAAFSENQLDWITLSNHLRVENRDHAGNPLAAPIAMSRGIGLYEAPFVSMQQEAGLYTDKLIASAVEWDMPKHEHFGIGILTDEPGSAEALAALREFEYRFTDRDPSMFDASEVSAWGSDRWYSTHDDAMHALAWLKERYPRTSYGVINHPSRYPDRYKVSDFREMNDLAPEVVFALEGMVGNQMEPDRGGYANTSSRTHGGVDAVVARLGGVWDALLGEGRRIWNVGNSDFHFKTADGKYSSGYFPGEYAKNHVWVESEGMLGVLAGLRSGKLFSVTGDLISALEFTAGNGRGVVSMGGELSVRPDTQVQLTIRFKSELPSHYETPLGSGNVPGAMPRVHHVDLIAGNVAARAEPGTPEYDQAVNPSTRVLARFATADLPRDAEGYFVVQHVVNMATSQYFRLRGTNLDVNVAGEMQDGEPLADAKIEGADNQARFDAINDRNYADLWFYSSPIFVMVR